MTKLFRILPFAGKFRRKLSDLEQWYRTEPNDIF